MKDEKNLSLQGTCAGHKLGPSRYVLFVDIIKFTRSSFQPSQKLYALPVLVSCIDSQPARMKEELHVDTDSGLHRVHHVTSYVWQCADLLSLFI